MEKFIESNLIFCGLVSGYQGEGNTATPQNAASAVSLALHQLGVDVSVRPAVCVYHTDWGCPQSGEPVGAFILSGEKTSILAVANALRQNLKQSTLSVGFPEKNEYQTIGFVAKTIGEIREIGSLWQKSAAQQMGITGTYVSCGIADNGDGTVTISAEANPSFVQDLESWRKIVETICAEVGAEPCFATVGFNYLRDAE